MLQSVARMAQEGRHHAIAANVLEAYEAQTGAKLSVPPTDTGVADAAEPSDVPQFNADGDVCRGEAPRSLVFVHSALDDAGLTPAEFRIFAHLARRAGKNGDAYPAVDSVAGICRLHPDTVRAVLRKLEEYGMITRIRRPGFTDLFRLQPPACWAVPPRGKQGAPSESRGVKAREGYPSETKAQEGSETKGGHPSESKGDEGNPPKGSTEGDPIEGTLPGIADVVQPRKAKRFVQPSPDEVATYSASINYPLDGQAWCDAYAQKGWMVGKTPMKDWKAAVRNWKANGWKPNGQGGNRVDSRRIVAPTAADHARGFFHGTEFENHQ